MNSYKFISMHSQLFPYGFRISSKFPIRFIFPDTVSDASFWYLNIIAVNGRDLRRTKFWTLLEGNDRIVIGSSRTTQLETNLSYMKKGPLAAPVVEFFDQWWKSTAHLCPSYLR